MKIYQHSSILTCLIALPMIGALVLALLPAKRLRLVRNTALAVLAGMLVIAAAAALLFNWQAGGENLWQLRQNFTWIAPLNIHYRVAADSLSLPLILLLCGMNLLAGMASYGIDQQVKTYYIMLLWLAAMLTGALAATDLVLFGVFGTLAVVPAYFLVGLWGGEGRRAAAMKFGLFNLFSAAAMFAALLAIFFCTRQKEAFAHSTFNLIQLTAADAGAQWHSLSGLWPVVVQVAFWLLLAATAIRMAVPALHIWLPDVMNEAAAPAAMVVVGGNLILGAYGLLAVVLPMFPGPTAEYALVLGAAAAGGMLYAALCALAQSDLRRGLAYWLAAQAGLILLAALTANAWGWNGAILLVTGDVTALIFLLWIAYVVERRLSHRDLNRIGGLAQIMPGLFSFALVGLLGAMAVPGLALFPAFLMTMVGLVTASQHPAGLGSGVFGTVHAGPWWIIFAGAAGAATILIAAYMLWTIERIFLGRPRPEHLHLIRLTGSEKAVLVILTFAMVVCGIFPAALIVEPVRQTVQHLTAILAAP